MKKLLLLLFVLCGFLSVNAQTPYVVGTDFLEQEKQAHIKLYSTYATTMGRGLNIDTLAKYVSKYIERNPTPSHINTMALGYQAYDTLWLESVHIIVSCDSSEIYFPSSNEIPEYWYYHLSYLGIDADSVDFENSDGNDIIYFPQNIYAWNAGPQNYTGTNYMSHDHPDSRFRLKKNSHFQLYWIKEDNKFIITRKEWNDYNY